MGEEEEIIIILLPKKPAAARAESADTGESIYAAAHALIDEAEAAGMRIEVRAQDQEPQDPSA